MTTKIQVQGIDNHWKSYEEKERDERQTSEWNDQRKQI